MRIFFLAALAAAMLAGCDGTWERRLGPKEVPITKPLPKESPTSRSAGGDSGPVRVADLTSRPDQPATTPASAPDEPAAAPLDKPSLLTEKPQVVAQSVVQVNDTFLTVDDILVGARTRLGQMPAGIREETFRKQAATIVQEEIRDQINELLVAEEAAGRLTDAMKEEVNREMAETERVMIAKAGGSRVRLEQTVLTEGTTLEKMLKEHRRRLESRVFVQARIMPSVMVNRRLLWEYYQAHKAGEFTRPKMVRMQTITIKYRDYLAKESRQDPSAEEMDLAKNRARDEMKKALAALKATPFEEVAKQYSKDAHAADGGLWPLMPAGSFAVAKVEAAAFELNEGAVSDMIESDGNYYLVRAAKVQPGEDISFEDAQEKIDQTLRQRQFQKLSEEYYQKLVSRAVIVESKDFVQNCMDRAVERFWGKGKNSNDK